MILNNLKTAVQYLPSLNLDMANDRFNDFFHRAQEWLASHILGTAIEEILEADIVLCQTDTHATLRQQCQRVIAERALPDAIPEMDLQLTEAGFVVQNNDKFLPASSQRVDRLIAKMPERIAADVDMLVRFLMQNSNANGAYGSWRSTDQFKYLTAAFLPCYEDYNRLAIPKAINYEEYYDAIQMMSEMMLKVSDYYVSKAEVERLVGLYRGNLYQPVHAKAIANLRIVAVAAFNHDIVRARNAAIGAREVMLEDPDSFPVFKSSSAFNSPAVNLDGGKVANFL